MMTLTRDDKTPMASTDPIPVEINMMRPMTAGNPDCGININQMAKNNIRNNRRP